MDLPNHSLQGDYVYKDTPQRALKLAFLPPLAKKWDKAPLYFIIPGGGWWEESREGMLNFCRESVEPLRQAGFAVVSIDYRVVPEGVLLEDILTDCFDALRYTARYADVFDIDKDRIWLAGHSAGGQLALMLGHAPKDVFCCDTSLTVNYTVLGVIALSAVTDLMDKNSLRFNHDYIFGDNDAPAERERTSPLTYATAKSPATLLCAGTSDYVVFPKNAEMMEERLKAAGADVELVYSVGGGHSFEQMHPTLPPQPNMSGIQEKAVRFILDRM